QRLPPTRLGYGRATWAVLLLPYLEKDNIYHLWDLSKTYYDQAQEARLASVPSYFCPERRTAGSIPTASVFGDTPSWLKPTNAETPVILESTNYPGALGDYAVVIDSSGHDESGET